MAHPYHHSRSSVKQWGGTVEDYQRIHDWFDESKMIIADFRHRALRHQRDFRYGKRNSGNERQRNGRIRSRYRRGGPTPRCWRCSPRSSAQG